MAHCHVPSKRRHQGPVLNIIAAVKWVLLSSSLPKQAAKRRADAAGNVTLKSCTNSLEKRSFDASCIMATSSMYTAHTQKPYTLSAIPAVQIFPQILSRFRICFVQKLNDAPPENFPPFELYNLFLAWSLKGTPITVISAKTPSLTLPTFHKDNDK